MALDPKTKMIHMMKDIQPGMRIGKHEDFAQWQKKARTRLSELLGLPLEKCESDLRIEWTKEETEFTDTRFVFASEPDVDVVCELLQPKEMQEKTPLIICLQGHSTGMHISLGLARYPDDEEDIKGDRDYALQAVKQGYAALTLEQRAFGERGGTEKGPACQQPAAQALLLGQTLIGQRCWDVSRAIDLIETEFKQLDMKRIAVIGNSGGGTTSIYAAALDERITATMPSCAFCGYYASIGKQLHCLCNYVPGIMKDFDMGDLAGLIAPRPMIVINGKDDGSFPLYSAMEQAEIARAYYALAGSSEKFSHVVGPEGHRFYADLAWHAFDATTGWRTGI